MGITKRYMVTMKKSCSCSMPGVWKAAAHSKGALVIFHSPKACAHIAATMDLGNYYRAVGNGEIQDRDEQYRAPMLVSTLKEEHAVFGGAEQLSDCIEYAMNRYKPEYIVIANSCVVGVIGDDTEAVAAQAEEKWQVPVLAIPCYGFLAKDYYEGYYKTAYKMIEKMMRTQGKVKDSVVLIGDRGGPASKDIRQLSRLLECFDLTVRYHFPSYTSREEIEAVPSAALSVPLGGSPRSFERMRQLSQDLQGKFDVPFYDSDYPVGLRGTLDWLSGMGSFLGKNEQAQKAIEEQKQHFQKEAAPMQAILGGLKAVCCIGRPLERLTLFWVIEMIALSKVDLNGIVLLEGLTQEQKKVLHRYLATLVKVPIVEEGAMAKDMIEQTNLFITTHELKECGKRQFFLPMLPPVGIHGLLEMLHKLVVLAKRSKKRGGIIYG